MKKLFVLGDSISIHYGPHLERYMKGKILYSRKGGIKQAEQDMDIAQGANGGDSYHVYSYLNKLFSSGGIDADILLLNCGLHDIKRSTDNGSIQIPLEQYRENLEKIVHIVTKMKLIMIWVRTTPVDDKNHNSRLKTFYRYSEDCIKYNLAADKIMGKAEIPIIDLYSFTLSLDEELFLDHIHFTETVRRSQAAFIAGFLNASM